MTMDLPLSEEDRKMLKFLVDSEGRISSQEISEQFGVPLSTVQRRRRRLEERYFLRTYSLDPMKFGYRRIELLIYAVGGTTIDLGKELLKRAEVTSVFRTIGEHSIDLLVEVFVKDNVALLDLLEQVKALIGVRDVVWTEIFEPIDGKSPVNHAYRDLDGERRPSSMIDRELKNGGESKFSPLSEVPSLLQRISP